MSESTQQSIYQVEIFGEAFKSRLPPGERACLSRLEETYIFEVVCPCSVTG